MSYTSTVGSDGQAQCYNMYDVRLKDSHPSCGMNWPPDLKHMRPYLRDPDVVRALHVDKNKATGWEECVGSVGSAMRNLKSLASVTLLPGLLAEIPILLFSGAEDLICNHMGTEAFVGNLEWNGGKGFELTPGTWAPRRDWSVDGEKAGFWQEARNMTYVLFEEASHMVPFDHPRRSRDMLDRFMGVGATAAAPISSKIDGEKPLQSSVDGDVSRDQEVEEAKWHAYRRSGEIALVVAIVAFCGWAFVVWRDRRKRRGYRGVAPGEVESTVFAEGDGDLEGGELDELNSEGRPGERRYSVGSDSEDEDVGGPSGSK